MQESVNPTVHAKASFNLVVVALLGLVDARYGIQCANGSCTCWLLCADLANERMNLLRTVPGSRYMELPRSNDSAPGT